MSKQFNVRISYNELKKRYDSKMNGFSEPSLRKFIQNNTIPYKKISFVESLLEFSAVNIHYGGVTAIKNEIDDLTNILNAIFKMSIFKAGELKNTIIEINKLRLSSLEEKDTDSFVPATIEILVDCLNYLFFYADAKLREIINSKFIAYELNQLKSKLSSVKFIGELQFIQSLLNSDNIEENISCENNGYILDENNYPVATVKINDILTSFTPLQFKIFIRFCFAFNSDSPFFNPFTELPKSLATCSKNSKTDKGLAESEDKIIVVESNLRATDKVFFHKQSLDRYQANPADPFGQILNSNLLEELSHGGNKWDYCFNFNIKSKLTKLDKLILVNPKSYEMKTDYKGNIIWVPPFEDFIKTPNMLTKPLGEIVAYTKVNVLLFLPPTFLETKILKPLRDFLVKNFNVKLVVNVICDNPQIKTYAVLICKHNSELFCPSYLRTSEWSALVSAVDKVGFNDEKIGAKINVINEKDETAKSSLGCWVVE